MLGKGDTDHVVVMDAKDEDGRSLGSTPMELLIMSLGGCSLMDVVDILEKMRHNIEKLTVSIKAERAETYPMKIVSLEFSYNLWGDVPQEKLEKAVALSPVPAASLVQAPASPRVYLRPIAWRFFKLMPRLSNGSRS